MLPALRKVVVKYPGMEGMTGVITEVRHAEVHGVVYQAIHVLVGDLECVFYSWSDIIEEASP